MGKIRRSRRSSLALLLLAASGAAPVACGGAGGLQTALSMPSARRKPDGVLLEPAPALPVATDRGSARGGVVALRQPIPDDQISAVIHAYFRAFEERNVQQLFAMLGPDAVSLDPTRRLNRGGLRQDWQARINRFTDLGRIAGVEVARMDRLERFGYDDLGPASDPPRPTEMQPGDVLIRVPLASPISQATGDAFFGDVLVLLLRRDPDGPGLSIAGVAELSAP